jgi:hypothetical protein
MKEGALSLTIRCAACSEENKVGSTRCARCGAVLKVSADAMVDPELAAFNANQAAMSEKSRQEHCEWMMRDLATTAGVLILPR